MGVDRDRLVEEHLPLARSIAAQLGRGLPPSVRLDDLVAAGARGLVEAARRYDPARGVAFSTFAYYRVRGAIYDELRRMSWLPRAAHARARFLERADELAERAGGTPPPSGEEAVRAVADVLRDAAMAYVATAESVDHLAAPGESPEAAAEARETRGRVRGAIALLPDRERTVLELHYFQDLTLEEAGRRMGLSKSWASRLHARALGLLRAQLPDTPDR